MKNNDDGLMSDWADLQRTYMEDLLATADEHEMEKVRARLAPIYAEIDNNPVKVPLVYFIQAPQLIDNLVHLLRLAQLALRDGVFDAPNGAAYIGECLDSMFKPREEGLDPNAIPY
jgi:hypothetical protein